MKIIIIAAVAKNNAIGKDNQLLWKLADDMKFFKETTSGHAIITGRKNYESIPPKFRPLPNRMNIVVTRNAAYNAPGAHVAHSLEQGIEIARAQAATSCFIIGGGEIYKEALEKNLVTEMYISAVEASPEADTFFPAIVLTQWNSTSLGTFPANDKNQHAFTIHHYTHK